MAVIENRAVRTPRAARNGTPSRLLVTAPNCPAGVIEAYQTLLTNVDLALGPDAGAMVAVAALDESADGPLVAANLSLVAAQSGDRTLLVDCDIQTPALHHLLGLDAEPGMAQFLGGEHTDLRTLAQPTQLETLGVIAAGAGGARHGRLARLGDIPSALLRLKNAADRVFLVTAPVLVGTDLLRLAPYVDGIVLVMAAGRTQREVAARARSILEKAQAPVLGVALTPA